MRIIGILCVALFLVGAAPAEPPIHAQKAAAQNTPTDVLVTEHWIALVQHHAPGVADVSVAEIWNMTPDERAWLPIRLERFLNFLITLAKGMTASASSGEQKRILDIAKDIQRIDAAAFIERAVMLHTDAVFLGDLAPPRPTPVRPAANSGRSGAASGTTLVNAKDGEYVSTSEANWNWPWSRHLAGLLLQLPADGFLGAWYHASTAYMMGRRLFGEAEPHLARALAVLPNDARILFNQGCLFEALGLPRVQQLVTPEDRIVADTVQRSSMLRAQPWAALAHIPREAKTNADAERMFRRALEVDAHLAEARVRLARLLVTRGQFADAVDEALRGLAESADGTVTFFAHLFAGRANQALGKTDLAAQQFQSAVTLFPDAQSALVAQSQLALMRADVPGALAPIRHLSELSFDTTRRVDPWWQYDFGAGRVADELAADLWARIGRLSSTSAIR